MSKITVDNLRKSGESADRDISGMAAAWVDFDGTGVVAVNNSLNVSSMTDNGVGDYDTNFTNSFGTTNYAGSGSFLWGSNGNQIAVYKGTVGVGNVLTLEANAYVDKSIVNALFHGDLA